MVRSDGLETKKLCPDVMYNVREPATSFLNKLTISPPFTIYIKVYKSLINYLRVIIYQKICRAASRSPTF